MTDARITPAIVSALAGIEYDEDAQHERAMHAMNLVRDDIADGRAPDRRLIDIALACACRPCLDGMVEQARELGPWLAVAQPSPPSPVERFVYECCELTPGSPSDATPAEFCEAYRRWARDNGEGTGAVSAIGLGRELSARFGIRSTPVRSVRIYRGLALRQSAATDDESSANGASRAQPVPQAPRRAQVGAQVEGSAIAVDNRRSVRVDGEGSC
ncbi:hypothetical protein MINTM020_37840 [Mycobacterium paraintracellulare]|uniref:hypothetical protein n=1 Tax=Mycobacterium paraintracellulare TaxID=1138383 RepID=UPI001925905D|nr:hypothetical protein [Mycobacterium paraintracellulare]BCP11686.1 hypothetical protein MINTM020_37840 [Mycobacterium paraintracellulare]